MTLSLPGSASGSTTTPVLPSSSNGSLLLMAVETDPSETPAITGWTQSAVETSSASKLTLLSIVRGGSTPSTTITGTTDHRVCVMLAFRPGTFDPITPFDVQTYTQESGTELTTDGFATQPGDGLVVFACLGHDISTNRPYLFNATFPDAGDSEGLARLAVSSSTTGNGGRVASFFASAHTKRSRPIRVRLTPDGYDDPAVVMALRINAAAQTLPVVGRYLVSTTKPLQPAAASVSLSAFSIPSGVSREVTINMRAKLRSYASNLRTLNTQSSAFNVAATTSTLTILAGNDTREPQCWIYAAVYRGVTSIDGWELMGEHTDASGYRCAIYRTYRDFSDSLNYTVNLIPSTPGRVIYQYFPDGYHDPDDVVCEFEDVASGAGDTIVIGADDPDDGEPFTLYCGAFWANASTTDGVSSETLYRPSEDDFNTAHTEGIYSATGLQAWEIKTPPLLFPFDATISTTQTNAHTGVIYKVLFKRGLVPSYWGDADSFNKLGSCSLNTVVPGDSTHSATLSSGRLVNNIRRATSFVGTYASGSKRTATITVSTPTFTAAPIEVEGEIVVRGTSLVASYYPAIGSVDVDTELPYVSLTFTGVPTRGAGSLGVYEIGTNTPHTVISDVSTDPRVTVVGNEMRVALDSVLSTTPRGYYVVVSDAAVTSYDGTYFRNGVDGCSNWYFTCRSVRARVTNNTLVRG